MGTEENKAVVHRFMREVLAGGDLDVVDQVLAPDYVNLALGGADLAGTKAMLATLRSVLVEERFDDEEMAAEGDAVFARFYDVITLADGTKSTSRALAYYRLADGKIVVNDVMFDPDLMKVLGPLMAPPAEPGPSTAPSTVALAQRVIDLTTGVIGNIAADQLGNSTPCAEWAVRDVLDHITNGAALYAMSVAPGSVPDELMAKIKSGGDYQGSWALATTLAMAAAAQPGALDKIVTLPFGEMTAGAFLGYVIFDLTTHATDLARATGQTITDTELLEAALEAGHRTVGPELRQPGVFDPEQPVPADAPMVDRLQAFAGRRI